MLEAGLDGIQLKREPRTCPERRHRLFADLAGRVLAKTVMTQVVEAEPQIGKVPGKSLVGIGPSRLQAGSHDRDVNVLGARQAHGAQEIKGHRLVRLGSRPARS